jgi:hypothetical protein
MLVCFYRRGMITIFPLRPFPILPLIKLLPSPSGYQLNGIGDDISIVIVSDKKMNMVGGHHVVEHTQAKPLLCFEEPLEPSAPVSGKLEQEFFFVAAVRDMPDTPRNVMPISTRHFHSPFLKRPILMPKKAF